MSNSIENQLSYVEEAVNAYGEIISNVRRINDFDHVNKGELFVLRFLTLHNEQVLPSELSAALFASTARISALLGKLEKKGQIVRDIDKNNRRHILVTITESGRERVNSEVQKLSHIISQIFMEMGEEDTATFIRLQKRFNELSQKHKESFLKKNACE